MTAGTPAFRMPAFSLRDQRDAVAEPIGMIHGDRRDNRQRWPRDYVGRIESAAESYLEDHGVGRMLGKCHEGCGSGDLEER